MPPTRRKSSAPTAHAQKTLAFGTHSNKVTKPTTAPPTSKPLSNSKSSLPAKPSPLISEVSTREEPVDAPQNPKPEHEEISIPAADQGLAFRVSGTKPSLHDEFDNQARKVSDAQVKRYWKGKEDERKAPRGMFPLPIPLPVFLPPVERVSDLYHFARHEMLSSGYA